MSGGGGAMHIGESGRRSSIYCFYTIHFKVSSTPSTVELKGAFHESCYLLLSNTKARDAVFTRPKYIKIKRSVVQEIVVYMY
jgi:hypothetical protein